jgi:ABC-type nickel/cobalt efflux system permease component RcnA
MEALELLLSIISGLLLLLIGILGFWAKKVDTKLDRIESKQAEHNTNTVERLTRVETTVGSINSWVEDIDSRVRTIEMTR